MGRHRLSESRCYNIQEIQERHHQMLRLRLLGRSNAEIAEVLKVTPQNVSDVLNSPLAQERLAVLRCAADTKAVDIAAMLMEEAPKCLELIRKVRDNDPTLGESVPVGLRLHAAESLLDRQGTSKIQNIRGTFAHALVPQEMIEEMKERARAARQAAIASGEVIPMPQREAV